MSETFDLQVRYDAHANTTIELPEGKTKEDIASIFAKWGQVTITFTDKTTLVIEENDASIDYSEASQIRLYSDHQLAYEE